jgi:hypothetical protein
VRYTNAVGGSSPKLLKGRARSYEALELKGREGDFCTDFLSEALQNIVPGTGETGMKLLRECRPGMRALFSEESMMAAWREWATDGYAGSLSGALRRMEGPRGSTKGERNAYTVAPHRVPEPRVREELQRAARSLLVRNPRWGLRFPATVPEALRPTLSPADVQYAWDELLGQDRPADALYLWEGAPDGCRPAPSEAQLAVLLGSTDARVRLSAIRKAADTLPAPNRAAGAPDAPACPVPGPTSTARPAHLR